jgi:orotidine-5'-phosphate decarboxylase
MKPDQLILALDMDSAEEALQWVKRLKGRIGCFKIGLQLYTREGNALVKQVLDQGVDVFLDLKLHDIPNTVAKAVASVCSYPLRFVTLHTLGGKEMMQAAVEQCPKNTTLLGVTILTSMNEASIQQLGMPRTVEEQVALQVEVALSAGMKGFVCSPLEVSMIRQKWGSDLVLVTPGVRPANSQAHDQSRVMTPEQAIEAGSTCLVLGRPILQAQNPEAVLDELLD